MPVRCFRLRLDGRAISDLVGLDADQVAPDGQYVARLSVQLDDDAVDRRGHLDRCLVGEYFGDDGVGCHAVADADEPFDHLGLGDTFADVGKLHVEAAH